MTRAVAEETLVVPVRSQVADLQALFVLNETGTLVWSRLDGATSLTEIARDLAQRYEVGEAEALADTLELVGRLREAGLLREGA